MWARFPPWKSTSQRLPESPKLTCAVRFQGTSFEFASFHFLIVFRAALAYPFGPSLCSYVFQHFKLISHLELCFLFCRRSTLRTQNASETMFSVDDASARSTESLKMPRFFYDQVGISFFSSILASKITSISVREHPTRTRKTIFDF